jgi:protein TonB
MQRTPLNLGPNRRLLSITAFVVVGLHVLVLLLWWFDWRTEDIQPRPDLDIELSTPAPVTATTPAPVAAPAEPPTAAPVTPPAPIPQPPAPQEPTAPTAAAPAPSAPAKTEPRDTAPVVSDADVLPSALTAEADYKAAELNNPKPLYPLTAVRQGLQGRVLLMVEVQADGRAGRVTIEKSSGHAILDASAMNTVRMWQFIPARKDGVFHAQSIRVPIDFNLK